MKGYCNRRRDLDYFIDGEEQVVTGFFELRMEMPRPQSVFDRRAF